MKATPVFPCVGSPEGQLAAPPESLAIDLKTGLFYFKEMDAEKTGWTAVGSRIWDKSERRATESEPKQPPPKPAPRAEPVAVEPLRAKKIEQKKSHR